MAKHNCALWGREIGLLTEQKLADGSLNGSRKQMLHWLLLKAKK